MVFIGSSDDRVKAQTLAEVLETTIGMVPQIVGPLVKAGWVRSNPGPLGGYENMTRIARAMPRPRAHCTMRGRRPGRS
jgi:DNA-binding IscR family transcriptional regulator